MFSKRATTPAVPATGWQPDGSGVTTGGPPVEGQLGAAYRVRFMNPAVPGYLITLTYFAEEDGCQYAVGRVCQFLICSDPSDPDGTRIWAGPGDGYDQVLGPFPSGSYAGLAALDNAEWCLGRAVDVGTWASDGFAGYGG
jgi:hypothetical protein